MVENIFKKITESEFKSKKSPIIFSNKNDRSYGEIHLLDNFFVFSWSSEVILPKIKEINKSIYAIGIDLNFAIINFDKNKILLNLTLDNYFLDFIMYENYIYVAAQLYIIQIETINFSIVKEHFLPDFFENFIINKLSISIVCMNKEVITI